MRWSLNFVRRRKVGKKAENLWFANYYQPNHVKKAKCCCNHTIVDHKAFHVTYFDEASCLPELERKGLLHMECSVNKCNCLFFETDALSWFESRSWVLKAPWRK